jgi:hypothetical protein
VGGGDLLHPVTSLRYGGRIALLGVLNKEDQLHPPIAQVFEFEEADKALDAFERVYRCWEDCC